MALTKTTHEKIYSLLSFLNISRDLVEITEESETVKVVVNVPEADAGIYIGRFASTLDSLQLLISLMLNQPTPKYRVLLDIGDYRARRYTILQEMVERISTLVESSGVAHALPPISSTERRQVHLMFESHPTLTTYSQGEGEARRLFIATREPKILQ